MNPYKKLHEVLHEKRVTITDKDELIGFEKAVTTINDLFNQHLVEIVSEFGMTDVDLMHNPSIYSDKTLIEMRDNVIEKITNDNKFFIVSKRNENGLNWYGVSVVVWRN